MAKRIKYSEGDVFAIPLADEFGGGYAVGVLTRSNSKYSIGQAFFFGPRRTEIPALEDVLPFERSQAVLRRDIGCDAIRRGDWPIIGRIEPWIREDWKADFGGSVDPLERYYREEFDHEPNEFGLPTGGSRISKEEYDLLPPRGMTGAEGTARDVAMAIMKFCEGSTNERVLKNVFLRPGPGNYLDG